MWRALRLAVLALGACLFATAVAAQQAPLDPTFGSGFHGPGSPGFLPTCSSSFTLQNWLYSSNGFSQTTNWSMTNSGSTSPSITSTTDTAPDGTATAADVSFGAIAGNTQYSLLSETINTNAYVTFYNWTQQLWVKVKTAPGTGYISLSLYNGNPASQGANSNGQNYVTVKIPNDGRWRLLTNYIPANWTTAHTIVFQIGPDGRDPNEPTTVSAGTLAIWDGQFAQGHSEGGKGWPYFANAATSGTPPANYFTLACPPTIAFRDFGTLKPWTGNNTSPNFHAGIQNITVQSTTAGSGGIGLYQQGGVGDPFLGSLVAYQNSGTYAGELCGFSATTDGTVNSPSAYHEDWPAFALYCGKNIFSLTEAKVGQPQLTIPGYVFPATTASTHGTPPCLSGCTGSQTSFSTSNVAVSASGVVTLTMGAAITPGPGTAISVSGFSGTSASYVNGVYPAISPTGGGTTTITYQSSCSSGCSATLTGTATVSYIATWNSYSLHGSWLQGGCNGGYKYCMLFSAEANPYGTGNWNMLLAYSNTIDSGWCVYASYGGCNNGSPTAGTGATNMPTGLAASSDAAVGTPQLPTAICLPIGCPSGATNYVISQPNTLASSGFVIWTSPAGNGVAWTYSGWITQPAFGSSAFTGVISSGSLTASSVVGPIQGGQTLSGAGIPAGTTIASQTSGTTDGAGVYALSNPTLTVSSEAMTSAFPTTDWDAHNGPASSRLDPFIYLNKCGFFEFLQTSYQANLAQPPTTGAVKNQAIGYWVATDIRGPFYHYNNGFTAPFGVLNTNGNTGPSGAIIPFNSPLYNSFTTIGEANMLDDPSTGTLYLINNTDNGAGVSSGVGGYLKDACQ